MQESNKIDPVPFFIYLVLALVRGRCPSPLRPMLPEAGERASPRVIRVRELALLFTSYTTQEKPVWAAH